MRLRILTIAGVAVATGLTVAADAAGPSVVDVDVDLSRQAVGRPHRVEIPAGQSVRVRFTHRVPSAAYELVVQQPGALSRPRPFPGVPAKSHSFRAECRPAQAAMDAFLAAVEETHVPVALATLRAAVANGTCVEPQGLEFAEQSATLVHHQSLQPGQRASLELSRARGTDRIVWMFEVVGVGAAPAWRQPTESAWIAASIVTDVAEMTAFAAGRPLPAPESIRAAVGDGDRVTVSVPDAGTAVTLDSSTSVWSTSPYAPLARTLLSRAGVRPTRRAPASTSRLAEALLRPTPAVLMEEDRRLSAALSTDAASAANHEQAALLLAAFALRERAGWLSDVRPALNRVTAHLVLAEALRGEDPATVDGRVAAATVAALSGRQVEALAAVRLLPRSTPAIEAWARALELRITGDWRKAPSLGAQPPLVAFEAFHALLWRKTVPSALDALEGVTLDQVDWARIATGASAVEVARRYGPAAVSGSFAEAAEVHRALRGQDLPRDGLAPALNVAPERAVTRSGSSRGIAVLGWGQWGAFLQRHVLSAVDTQQILLLSTLGLPEEAEAFARQTDAIVGGLDLHPLVVYRRNTRALGRGPRGAPRFPDSAAEAGVCRKVADLVGRRPEAVAFEAWGEAVRRCSRERDTGALPSPDGWFRPLVLPGTALQGSTRMGTEAGIRHGLDRIEGLHALAPYDADVARFYVGRRFGGQATADEYRAAMGPLVEYDVDVLEGWIATAPRNTAVATEVRERLCAMAPDGCFSLGELFALEGRPDDAVKAYEKAIAGTRDRVAVSSSVGWLVDRLWDTSRKDRAVEIAREAAETYSTGGLFTLARVLERAGQLAEAEAALQAIAERYEDPSYLDSFYIRRDLRFDDGAYRQKGKEAMARRFPRGLEKVTAADFHAPPAPQDGVLQNDVSNRLLKLGVLPGDIVVAIDGYRVRDNPQWIAASSLTDGQEMTVTVWRGGGYADIKGPYLRLKFGP